MKHHSSAQHGFTLLEMLIAMALMAVMLVGILPLFTKSMSNNVEGNQLTEVTNRAREHVEKLLALSITAEELTVPAGQTVLQTSEMYSDAQDVWIEEADFPADEVALYSRITEVRQYSLSAIDFDTEFSEAEALNGSEPTQNVHLKEIIVRVNSGRPTFLSMLGRNKAVTLRVFKSI